jgi:hypothetical protein
LNIYALLGADTPELDEDLSCPHIFSDGSCDDATKAWVLNKLGFINRENLKFDSWCQLKESGCVKNVVPYSVEIPGSKFCLDPTDIPGGFLIIYGLIENRKLILPNEYSQFSANSNIDTAIADAQLAIDEALMALPESKTKDIYLDKRYQRRNTWEFKSNPCKIGTLRFFSGEEWYFAIEE